MVGNDTVIAPASRPQPRHSDEVSVAFDPVTERHIAKAIDDLAVEFEGIFSREAVDRYVHEGLVAFADAKVVEFVSVLAYRHSQERLRALGQTEGMIEKTVPEVLFVCVHNAGRSQMAAGLVNLRSDGRIHVRSAGSDPGEEINPAVVQAMDGARRRHVARSSRSR